ncbi:MAG: holo-ACP synthase [Treponema sp.]|jgi:holo-[acyl-carrier protein] synthase|nr:holo-ACP synthase [Treponema sp.]
MIVGFGIDAVFIPRLEKWAGDSGLLERFFHPDEIRACREKGRGMIHSLAARFAVKEAFGKALGTGLSGFGLKDVMVKAAAGGKPELELFGNALGAMRKTGAAKAHVSLTHDGQMAFAAVILESGAQ